MFFCQNVSKQQSTQVLYYIWYDYIWYDNMFHSTLGHILSPLAQLNFSLQIGKAQISIYLMHRKAVKLVI